MPKITFIQKDNSEIEVEAEIGKTLLDVIKENNINLIGACNGACACGTCHVLIDEETLSKIEPAKEDEEDILDIVFGIQHNSRLACQVIITEQMEDAIITIP
jgi:2Fe-2S ferredoxin